MITQRIAGLQALLTACQIVLALVLFWGLALLLVSPRAPEGAGVETLYLG